MCVWSPIELAVWSRVCAAVYTLGLALDRRRRAQYFDPCRSVAKRYNKLAIKRERVRGTDTMKHKQSALIGTAHDSHKRTASTLFDIG